MKRADGSRSMSEAEGDSGLPKKGLRAMHERKRREPTRSHVLVVEDDEEMRGMLAFVLARRGFRVTQVRDGSKALEYLAEIVLVGNPSEMPQLLLTDQRMPGVCGLDVIEATRVAGLRIPALLVTAFGDVETHERARALGETPVLEKPLEIGELLAVIERIAP